MPNMVSSKKILESALYYQHTNPQERIIPENPKVSGIWDTVISTIYPRNEVTAERSFAFLPKAIERLIGDFSYSSLVAVNGGLSFHAEKKMLIEQVKNNLLPKIRREFDWDIRLVSGKDVNAAALPGGKIIICEGLIDTALDYLRANMDSIEAGLSRQREGYQADVLGRELQNMVAAVVGHEIAHADIGHSRSRIEKMILIYLVVFIGYLLTYLVFLGASNKVKKEEQEEDNKKANGLAQLATFFYNGLFRIGFTLYNLADSRASEYEADAMGMQVYMHEAGYDLNGAVRLMDMFCQKKVSSHVHGGIIQTIQEIFSTHPLSENRKKQAEQIRDRVQSIVRERQSGWKNRVFG